MSERRIPREIADKASDMITGVLWTYSPPPRIHTVFRGPNNVLVSAEANVQSYDGGGVSVSIDWAGEAASDVSIEDIADYLIQNSPQTALVCDHDLVDELEGSSQPWICLNGGDYRIEMRKAGNIEVFIPTGIQRP